MSDKMAFMRFVYIDAGSAERALQLVGSPYNRAVKADDDSWAVMRPSDTDYKEPCCDRCGTVYGFRPLIVIKNPEKILCDNCYVLETGQEYSFSEGEKSDGSDSDGTAI